MNSYMYVKYSIIKKIIDTYFCPNFKNLLEIIWHGGKLGLWKKEKIVVKYVKFVNMKESTIKEILLH